MYFAPLLKKRVFCIVVVDIVRRFLFSGTLLLLWWDEVLFGCLLGFAWFVEVGGIYLAPQMVILSQSQRL